MSKQVYNSFEQAFSDMHSFTAAGKPFKLKFCKLNGEIKIIPKAFLRKRTPIAHDANTNYKMNYIDHTNNNCGNCYIPLIMAINDKEIHIK